MRLLRPLAVICGTLCVAAFAAPATAGVNGATSPHLSVNPTTMRWAVSPTGDTGSSSTSGTLRVVVTINGRQPPVHDGENDGSGIFTGSSASGDVSEGEVVVATATTVVNGQVVDEETNAVHATSSSSSDGGCAE